MKQIYDFTIDIIDKQYRLYVWNDGKVAALVTIDAALLAGMLILPRYYTNINVFAFGLLMLAFACSIISFLICLFHAVPFLNSKIGNEENLRSMIGIIRLDKESYHKRIRALNLESMIKMNCWQIVGMNRNNHRSHRLIKSGVILTIAAAIILTITVPIIVFSNNGNSTSQQSTPIIAQNSTINFNNSTTPDNLSTPKIKNQDLTQPPISSYVAPFP